MRPHEEGVGEGAWACRWLAGARRSEALTLAHRPPIQLVGRPVPRRCLRVLSLIGMHAAYPRRMFSRLSQTKSGRTSVATATTCVLDTPKGWLSGRTRPVGGHSGLRNPIRLASLLSAAGGA